MPAAHDLVGYLAAALTALSFVPQAIKVIRTRETKDLSLSMYLASTLGLCMWLAYGIMIGSVPVMISNSITVLLASVILVMKIRLG